MTGTHVRLGVYPHGTLGATTTVDFAPDMFLRLQVLDYRDWFRRNPNPRNRLTRYTEGNLITPLIDGARVPARAVPDVPRRPTRTSTRRCRRRRFDPYVPVSDAAADRRQPAPSCCLSNAWIEPHTPLLGRRGLIAAPKTQDVAPDELPSFEALIRRPASSRRRACRGRSISPRRSTTSSSGGSSRRTTCCRPARRSNCASWFSPTTSTATTRASPARCSTPTCSASSRRSRARRPVHARSRAPPDGSRSRSCSRAGRDPMATLRITVWPPDGGEPAAHTYGQITLPQPADPFTQIPFSGPGRSPAGFGCVYEGVPGSVVVVFDAGSADARHVPSSSLNPRSGEVVRRRTHRQSRATTSESTLDRLRHAGQCAGRLPRPGRHRSGRLHALLRAVPRTAAQRARRTRSTTRTPIPATGRPPRSRPAWRRRIRPNSPGSCAKPSPPAWTSGCSAGVIRRSSGRSALLGTLGTVNAVNAMIGGRRGQAIWDGTSRETFHVHHQKGTFVRTASLDVVAFLGGIDIVTGRWDTPAHRQPDPERPGSTWHDVQCKIEGKAVWDVYRNIMQRWNAANALTDIVGADPGRTPLPPPDDPAWGPTSVVDDPTMTKADGPHAAQVNRTLAPHFNAFGGVGAAVRHRRPGYRRSVGAQHLAAAASRAPSATSTSRNSTSGSRRTRCALHNWLKAKPDRFVFLVIPRRFADIDIADQIHYALRRRCLNLLICGVRDLPPAPTRTRQPNSVTHRSRCSTSRAARTSTRSTCTPSW